MKDDSRKWALVFFTLGVYSGLGVFFQVSCVIYLKILILDILQIIELFSVELDVCKVGRETHTAIAKMVIFSCSQTGNIA